jgi:D-amino-acid oxidase
VPVACLALYIATSLVCSLSLLVSQALTNHRTHADRNQSFHIRVPDTQYAPWPRTERLPGSRSYGHTFSSYIINAPAYLAHLSSRCKALGIPLLRHRLSSLDEAYNIPQVGKVDLVVNATGLGARWLIGVEDEDVYPAKGQTILVKAPEGWRKRCVMVNEGFKPVAGDDGELSFTIRRGR